MSLIPETLPATQGAWFDVTAELPKSKSKRPNPSLANPQSLPFGITTQHLRDFVEGGELPDGLIAEAKRLADQYQFFHWHLTFPEVFAQGGFDVSLGNPPWERFKVSDIEFFAERNPRVAAINNAAKRQAAIASLEQEAPELFTLWHKHLAQAEGAAKFARSSGRFLLSAVGELNSHGMFVELSRSLISNGGTVGMIVPSGLATDKTYSPLFENIIGTHSLLSLYDFENRDGLFLGVHRMYKFCLLTLQRNAGKQEIPSDFVFFANGLDDLQNLEKHFRLTSEEISSLNPNTKSCPIFSNRRDALITKRIYELYPILSKDSDPDFGWKPRVAFVFEMNKHAHLFRDAQELRAAGKVQGHEVSVDGNSRWVALYEAKQIHQFDHRYATYDFRAGEPDCRDVSHEEHSNPSFAPTPRQYVRMADFEDSLKRRNFETRWFLTYRDITNAANERTSIFSVLPYVAMGNTWVLGLDGATLTEQAAFIACMNTFASDYIARRKVGGSHLNFYVLKQLAVPLPEHFQKPLIPGSSSFLNWLLPRMMELTYTAWDLEAFAQDCGWSGPPLRWDEERRFLLRCELDAAFFHLYLGSEQEWRESGTPGNSLIPVSASPRLNVSASPLLAAFPTPRDAVSYILDTFPIVKRKDEAKFNGDYRTKRTILEIYDALAESIKSGQPYQTRLNPPPADPRCCHPPKQQ